MSVLNKLGKLNSECFTWETWESNWWNLLDMDFMIVMDVKNVMRAVEKYAVGYCESDKVSIRPKENSYAVMFEKDGERFWFHIQKWEFETEEIE